MISSPRTSWSTTASSTPATESGSATSTWQPSMQFWSPTELATFLAATAADELFALYRLTAMSGLRRGEVCGLRWSDVDLDGSRNPRPPPDERGRRPARPCRAPEERPRQAHDRPRRLHHGHPAPAAGDAARTSAPRGRGLGGRRPGLLRPAGEPLSSTLPNLKTSTAGARLGERTLLAQDRGHVHRQSLPLL